MASCQTMGTACSVLRKPPEMQSPTRQAIFKDKPFLTWFGQVQADGKNYKCW